MVVDEDKKYVLTKYSTKGGKRSVKESDQYLLWIDLSIKCKSTCDEELKRVEVFNFKNDKDFTNFTKETGTNRELLDCLDNENDLDRAADKWLKIFQTIIKKCFTKIRLGKPRLSQVDKLLKKKENLNEKLSLSLYSGDLDEAEKTKEKI